MTGKLIIIEGADSSGKTTLIKGIKKAIKVDYVFNYSYPKEWEMFQQAANARGQYVASMEIFKQLLAEGKTIICDRFHLGEYAYGPVMRGYSEWLAEWIFTLEKSLFNSFKLKMQVKLIILATIKSTKIGYKNWKALLNLNKEYPNTFKQLEEINRRYISAFIKTDLPAELLGVTFELGSKLTVLNKALNFIRRENPAYF